GACDAESGALCEGRGAAGRRMRVLRVPRLLARLPAPPLHVERAPGVSAPHAPTRDLLPSRPARHARAAPRAAVAAGAFGPFQARFFARYAVSSVDVSRD